MASKEKHHASTQTQDSRLLVSGSGHWKQVVSQMVPTHILSLGALPLLRMKEVDCDSASTGHELH